MIPDSVTLIVKAPNQQVADQNILCETSWTVRQLKGHLAEVYPNKPKAEEQKIIYSGQLLEDTTVLKDVLRNYESQIAHTMHLVCSSRKMPEPEPKIQVSDGLRQRNVTVTESRPAETPRPEMRQNDQNHTVEMQNYLSSFVNNYGRVPPYPNYNFGELPVQNDPASMANHMLMMQQAYMQYMQQYANMAQAMTETPPPAPTEAPPPPNPEPEPEEGRDWLDHLYAASRFAILISLFCLYGSPARLLLVVLIAAAGYLHQIGFFRDLHVNPLNNGNQRNNPPQQNQPQNNQVQNNQPQNNQAQNNDPQNNQAQNNEPQNNQAQNNEPQNNQAQNNEPQTNENTPRPTEPINNDNQQSLLAVTWMIFTSFFASLIPETN